MPVEKLKVGMHVIMPESWFNHPFLKNQFLIKSDRDIRKMAEYGIDVVLVDFSKSKINDIEILDQNLSEAPQKFEPVKLIPPEMREAIRDRTIVPEQRAPVIRTCSKEIMKKLLEDPSLETVRGAKADLYEIVDCILADDEMATYLVKITDHDLYTYTHSVNVGILSLLLAKRYLGSFSDHDLRELGVGFFLHDLGKTRIDPAILNKQGRLTEKERLEVQKHPQDGFDILKEVDQVSHESKTIILQHHERDDGSGYPNGLKGDEIHLYARICSLADVYDALTCDRPYRNKLSPFMALKLIKRELLGHVQKSLFEGFVFMLGESNRELIYGEPYKYSMSL
ncbi:MAG TPA: HD-GYP domain-containing protein [Syntrophales bacterium]|jgi:HD-GYP domain-containing protein (c-di-GMP phosphodiesterase class II)|nr:HD-GYP domain-containing protein [Syntrophales bacterium]